LSVKIKERRLHSIATAAAETGIDAISLRRRLETTGIVNADDLRSDAMTVFPAKEVENLLRELARLVYLNEVRDCMGATETQFDGLVQEGILLPRISIVGFRRAWSVNDGLAVVDRLSRRGNPISAKDEGWIQIQDAARQSRAALKDIFQRVDAGNTTVGIRFDIEGYAGIHVAEADIKRQFTAPLHVGLAPSAFGVSIGLKAKGAVQTLIDQKYISATEIEDARKWTVHLRILEDNAQSFHKQFCTYRTTAEVTGLSWRRLVAIFRAFGVKPFSPSGGPINGLFEKAEVEAAVEAFQKSHKG